MDLLNNRYQQLRSVGRGGAGEVYLALDTHTENQVAVKRISPDFGLDLQLVDNEIKALQNLDHPGIIEFIESFESDGAVHLVTGYVKGLTIEEQLEQGSLPFETIGKYADQILDALDHIHSRGVIHSDLKPGNIIIDDEDNIRLIDFGIVRSASAEIAADIKEIRGTLHYMSPEQAEGNPYDVRSDLFSFGVILYELYAGHKPFFGDYDMAVVYSILYEDPTPPEKINNAISPELSNIILNLLAKSPADRPGSAVQVKEYLKNCFAAPAKPTKSNRNRIAIIPFKLPLDDADSKLIGDGLMDELYDRLRQVEGIEIVSPIKVARQADNLTDGNAIRDLLGIDSYLTGTVRKISNRVRIYLRHLSVDDETIIWSEKFDNPMSDLFDIIDTITDRVIGEFKARISGISGQKVAAASTTSPEAYELYLLARGYYVKNTRDDIEYARKMYLEALKIDPDYALAQVGVADCYCLEYMNYFSRNEQTIEKAAEWANKALSITPNLPETYRTLGRIMQVTGKIKEAASYFMKAVTYKEDYYQAYRSLGWLMKDNFEYNEALGWVRKSLSINSTDLETIYLKGTIHFERKESKQAINDFTRCQELRPDYGRAQCFLGMTFFQLGRLGAAIESMKQAIKLGGDINAPYLLGYYYLAEGDYLRAEEIFRVALRRQEISFIARYYLGLTAILSGKPQAAAEYFEDSLSACQNLLADDPSFWVAKSVAAKNMAFLGKTDDCRIVITDLILYSLADGSIAHDIAKALAVIGDREMAADFIGRAIETPLGPTRAEIALDPVIQKYYGKFDA